MVNWERKWKRGFSGWFGDTVRHSHAAKYGRAGGKYMQRKKIPDEASKAFAASRLGVFKATDKDKETRGLIRLPAEAQETILTGLMEGLDKAQSLTPEMLEAIDKEKKEIEQQKAVAEGIKIARDIEKEERAKARKIKAEAQAQELVVKETKAMTIKKGLKDYVMAGRPLEQALSAVSKETGISVANIEKSLTPVERKELKALAFKESVPGKAITAVEKGAHTVAERAGVTKDLIIPQYKPLYKRVMDAEAQRKLESMESEKRRVERQRTRELISGSPDADPLNSQNAGVFDPLGQLGVDDELSPIGGLYDFAESPESRPSPQDLYPHAYNTKRLVDDFYSSLPDLERNRLDNLFHEGEKAFKAGNREKLVNTIMDVDAERRNLMDRKRLVENVRSKVLNDQNAVELLHKDDDASGFFSFGSLFGGPISGELSEQTKRVNEARRVVDVALQKGLSYSDNMRAKLRRMDAATDYSKFEPEAPADVTPFVVKSGFNLDLHNPLLGKNSALTKVKDSAFGGVKLVL